MSDVTEESSPPEWGLLGAVVPIDPKILEMQESIKALFIRASLDQRERALNKNPFFGAFKQLEEIRFERRLLEFAINNAITLLNPNDWRLPALLAAAREHRELTPPTKRGRPSTPGGIGLLGDQQDGKRPHRDAAAYSIAVRDIMRAEDISQRKASYRLASELYPTYTGLSLESKAKQIENHVSAYNANRGERRKPGRIRGAAKKVSLKSS